MSRRRVPVVASHRVTCPASFWTTHSQADPIKDPTPARATHAHCTSPNTVVATLSISISVAARVDVMQRMKQKVAPKPKNPHRAELLLLEAQHDVLDGRIRDLEEQPAPARKLKRDPPLTVQRGGLKRPKHDVGILSTEELFNLCRKLLTQLKKNNNAGPFLLPVDPVALNIPDYLDIVKKPMDFKTITTKMRPAKRVYRTVLEFRDDVRQVFKNCSLYNPIGNQIRVMGDRLSETFEQLWARSNIEKMHRRKQDALKRAREGGLDDGGRSKKMRTHTPEYTLKKLTEIQSKMQELMSNATDKMSAMQIDAEAPMTFWQKRKLNAQLEGASESVMKEVCQALPEKEEDTEMVLDDMGDETVKQLWTAVIPLLSPVSSHKEEAAAAPTQPEDAKEAPQTVRAPDAAQQDLTEQKTADQAVIEPGAVHEEHAVDPETEVKKQVTSPESKEDADEPETVVQQEGVTDGATRKLSEKAGDPSDIAVGVQKNETLEDCNPPERSSEMTEEAKESVIQTEATEAVTTTVETTQAQAIESEVTPSERLAEEAKDDATRIVKGDNIPSEGINDDMPHAAEHKKETKTMVQSTSQ